MILVWPHKLSSNSNQKIPMTTMTSSNPRRHAWSRFCCDVTERFCRQLLSQQRVIVLGSCWGVIKVLRGPLERRHRVLRPAQHCGGAGTPLVVMVTGRLDHVRSGVVHLVVSESGLVAPAVTLVTGNYSLLRHQFWVVLLNGVITC